MAALTRGPGRSAPAVPAAQPMRSARFPRWRRAFGQRCGRSLPFSPAAAQPAAPVLHAVTALRVRPASAGGAAGPLLAAHPAVRSTGLRQGERHGRRSERNRPPSTRRRRYRAQCSCCTESMTSIAARSATGSALEPGRWKGTLRSISVLTFGRNAVDDAADTCSSLCRAAGRRSPILFAISRPTWVCTTPYSRWYIRWYDVQFSRPLLLKFNRLELKRRSRRGHQIAFPARLCTRINGMPPPARLADQQTALGMLELQSPAHPETRPVGAAIPACDRLELLPRVQLFARTKPKGAARPLAPPFRTRNYQCERIAEPCVRTERSARRARRDPRSCSRKRRHSPGGCSSAARRPRRSPD